MSAVIDALARAERLRKHCADPRDRRDFLAAELRGLRQARNCVHVGASVDRIKHNIEQLIDDVESEYLAAVGVLVSAEGRG